MTGNWKPVLRLEKNTNGRDFVCGDIHGCFADLWLELIKIGFDKRKDRLFCVGDLIDRGPSSEMAADYIKEPWFFSVIGNHEQMFIMGNLKNEDQETYLQGHIRNGGGWAYKIDYNARLKILQAVDTLPLIIQIEDTVIAHAALPFVDCLEVIEDNPHYFFETILWHRGPPYPVFRIPNIKQVYVGHSITSEPVQYQNIITNIDTGAFLKHKGKEGKLTIVEIGG